MFKGIAAGVACAVVALAGSPSARADGFVTYEVVSQAVRSATIHYESVDGRVVVPNAVLPWRYTVAVAEPFGAPPVGSQVRADWRPLAGPAKWLTVRVYHNGELICQNTLDVGNAACYGSTHRIT